MRFLISIALATFLPIGAAQAQNGNQGGGQGGNQGGGQGGGSGQQFPGGIVINPKGQVDRAMLPAGNGVALQRQLKQAASRRLSTELNQPSKLRKVSLRKLEAEIVRQLQLGSRLSPDTQALAGLTRIDYLFVMEDGQDFVIAGPAEGFAPLNDGRVIGVESGRPTLCLDDLLVAIRDAARKNAVGCSIDPDPTRLAASQQWLKQNSSPATVPVAKARLEKMVSLQGHWNITTFGVPEESRMCLAMIEADYLMKRIAIGIVNPGVRGLKNSLVLAAPGDNMMRRWWFAPHYETLERNEEGTAFHLSGPRFQLFGQEEIMNANGQLMDAALTQPSSEKFARLFNERIDELVRRVPAFGDLQNIFDVLTAAAIFLHCQSNETLKWTPELLLDAEALPVQSYVQAKETSPILNVKMSGSSLVIGAFSGGVTIQPRRIVTQFKDASHDDPQLRADQTASSGVRDGSWWWD